MKTQDLVTAYLLQHHECVLPGIGEFRVNHKPASFDSTSNLLLPAAEEIFFREGSGHHAVDLIAFIALKKTIPHQKAEEMLQSYCSSAKSDIKKGGKLIIDTFGSLQKNVAGNIYFSRDKSPLYFEPVVAEVVNDHDSEESVSPATYYNYPEPVYKSYWWVWAAVLFAIALTVGIYHFRTHPFSFEGIGNTATM